MTKADKTTNARPKSPRSKSKGQIYGFALLASYAVGRKAPDGTIEPAGTSPAETQRIIARQHCEQLERFFRATGNPIWATRAFIKCRNGKIEIPEWVLSSLEATYSGSESTRRFRPTTELRDNFLASEVGWRLRDVPRNGKG